MSRVLDYFWKGLYCGWCKTKTEHYVVKIDEDDNGEFIGYYTQCCVCGYVDDIPECELYDK